MPSVTYPFIPWTVSGSIWGTSFSIMGVMPVLEDYDLGLKEIKDRYGFPNYGDGPFFHAKIWPEKFQEGTTDYPSPFTDIKSGTSRGSGAWYFRELQGSFDDGELFYQVVHPNVIWSYPNYIMNTEAYMLMYRRKDDGDWYYTVHYKENRNWKVYIETDGHRLDPCPAPPPSAAWGHVASAQWGQQGREQRITTNGRITSSLVKYFKPVVSAEAELAVRKEQQVFDTVNALDIYVGGVASSYQAAYVDACQDLVNSKINSLGNILELASTLKGMAEFLRSPAEGISDLMKTYKDPRNAWLFYRYSYSTTKADIREYIAFISRLKSLVNLINTEIKAYGACGRVRCVIKIRPEDFLPSTVYDFLAMVGVEPNAQNIWDLVPYSFVADWFLGISKVLEWFDNWTYSLTIEPGEIWFSNFVEGEHYQVYSRTHGRKLNVPPLYTSKEASGKTWRLRFADAISLFS